MSESLNNQNWTWHVIADFKKTFERKNVYVQLSRYMCVKIIIMMSRFQRNFQFCFTETVSLSEKNMAFIVCKKFRVQEKHTYISQKTMDYEINWLCKVQLRCDIGIVQFNYGKLWTPEITNVWIQWKLNISRVKSELIKCA